MNAALRKLIAMPPGSSPAHGRLLASLEHALLASMKGGICGAERFVASLSRGGPAFELVGRGNRRRHWQAKLDGRRQIRLSAAVDRMGWMAWAQYEREPEPPVLTPREARIDALQKAFYARYNEIAAKAYGSPPRRIGADERTLLLVGDFEGGVSNGGFGTFILNKGPRRARATVVALESTGARRSARMLDRALVPGVTEAALSKLDERFFTAPEDIARLAARRMNLGGDR